MTSNKLYKVTVQTTLYWYGSIPTQQQIVDSARHEVSVCPDNSIEATEIIKINKLTDVELDWHNSTPYAESDKVPTIKQLFRDNK